MKTLCYRGVPVLGFAAYSGVGKTTVLKQLIPILLEQGVTAGVVKHTHHKFDIDHPGKDSYELRKSGAAQIIVGSKYRRAIIRETPTQQTEPRLGDFLSSLDTQNLDVILVEGFRHEHYPKIEINRQLDTDLLAESDDSIIAIISDRSDISHLPIAQLELSDSQKLATFVRDYIRDALERLRT